MNSQEYRTKLMDCSDEDLKDRCRIKDNWSILIKGDIEQIVNELKTRDDLELYDEEKKTNHPNEGSTYEYYDFKYLPGTVVFRVTTDNKLQLPLDVPEHQKEELIERTGIYNMSFIIHPYQHHEWNTMSNKLPENDLPDATWEKAMAIVIEDLLGFLEERKIPYCLSNVRDKSIPADISELVFWPKEN